METTLLPCEECREEDEGDEGSPVPRQVLCTCGLSFLIPAFFILADDYLLASQTTSSFQAKN
jgi:hypothetical protein